MLATGSAGKMQLMEWKASHAMGRANFKENLFLGTLVWFTEDKGKKTPKLAILGLNWYATIVI